VNVWVPPGVRSAMASGSIDAVRWNASHMVAGRSGVVISVLLKVSSPEGGTGSSPAAHCPHHIGERTSVIRSTEYIDRFLHNDVPYHGYRVRSDNEVRSRR